jgi:hypothetical protein
MSVSETICNRKANGDGGSVTKQRRTAPLSDTARPRKNSSTPATSHLTRPLRRVHLTKTRQPRIGIWLKGKEAILWGQSRHTLTWCGMHFRSTQMDQCNGFRSRLWQLVRGIIDCKTRILLLTEKHVFNCIYETYIIDCKTRLLNVIPDAFSKIVYSIVSVKRDELHDASNICKTRVNVRHAKGRTLCLGSGKTFSFFNPSQFQRGIRDKLGKGRVQTRKHYQIHLDTSISLV